MLNSRAQEARRRRKIPARPRPLARAVTPDLAQWVTLQRLILSEPGLSTQGDLFFRPTGDVFLSDLSASLRINPGAGVAFNTAFNLLGLEAIAKACRLGRLVLALRGEGLAEVTVMQSLGEQTAQRVFSDIVTLTPQAEVVLDLDAAGLASRAGVLWLELRAVERDAPVRLDQARFLTDARPDAALRLALLRPAEAGPEDPGLAALRAWAAARPDRVALLSGDSLPAPATQTQLLAAARAQGFSHVLLCDPETLIGPEALNRSLALLSLLRPGMALGATRLAQGGGGQLEHAGLARQADGTLTPLAAHLDLASPADLLDAASEMTRASPLALAQSGFAALALQDLPEDAVQPLRFGRDEVSALVTPDLHLCPIPGLITRRAHRTRSAKGLMTLQNLIFPEQGLCTEHRMYFHGTTGVEFDKTLGAISIEPQALAVFDTYFNLFSVAKWHEGCTLNGLWLGVSGRGRVAIKVFHGFREKSWDILSNSIVTLTKGQEVLIDLSHYVSDKVEGVIFFEVQALGTGVILSGARFLTEASPAPQTRLALSITTFRREAQVENTARRLAVYFDQAEFAAQMDCFIVDNGDSAQILPHPKIHRIPNANLGGAGGFTRGLLEAEAQGFSHVLFMDDDASIPLEALHRTYAFLALAKDPKTAIAGAMINTTEKWRMCENGAIFDRKCYPQFAGTDLRHREDVFRMEYDSAGPPPAKMYGGWWFFAFKVDQVERHPFPFFVRGDDVNFSLVNDFAITRLNGVVSFADDFVDKESPMTWYLDLRSHMVHHLTLDKMEVGPRALAGIGLSFFKRNIVKFQYETIEAIFTAWEDVLKGPDFFTQNADASQARATIKALTRNEVFKPVSVAELTEKSGFLDKNLGRRRRFYPYSLNGHFLPFFERWGSRRIIPAWQRGHTDAMWGAARLTFLNTNRDKAYSTARDNRRALRLLVRLVRLWLRTQREYPALRARYHQRYPEITNRTYWAKALALPAE